MAVHKYRANISRQNRIPEIFILSNFVFRFKTTKAHIPIPVHIFLTLQKHHHRFIKKKATLAPLPSQKKGIAQYIPNFRFSGE